MSIIPDDMKRQTFPCPQCSQIISSDVLSCKFCGQKIDEDLQSLLIHKELRERSLSRLKNHKLYIAAGTAVFCAGIATLIMPIMESQLGSRTINFTCGTPLLLLGGLGAAVMGVRGYLREKEYLRDV